MNQIYSREREQEARAKVQADAMLNALAPEPEKRVADKMLDYLVREADHAEMVRQLLSERLSPLVSQPTTSTQKAVNPYTSPLGGLVGQESYSPYFTEVRTLALRINNALSGIEELISRLEI